MTRPILSARCLMVVLSMLCASQSGAMDELPRGGVPSLNDLSMEVAALQAFHQFQLTPAQLETLRKFAKETAQESTGREAAKASGDFRRTLSALRDALVEEEDDLIDQLQEELDDLREKEKPELDDGIEVTEAARQRAPELLRVLSPRRIAYYLGNHVDEIPEPLERTVEALGKVRALDPKEWKQVRDAVSEEVGKGVAGLDFKKASQVGDQVVQLLIQARALKEEEFKAQRQELEKMAGDIVGNISPLDVLRHALALELAELLSNPRLRSALDARLKK